MRRSLTAWSVKRVTATLYPLSSLGQATPSFKQYYPHPLRKSVTFFTDILDITG